ncbi:MAG: competence/damage-inducible protein A [Elusimicrobiota bacterium]
MRVELICLGTELLTGKLNSNVSYLGDRLSSIGLDFSRVITSGDDRKEIERVFSESINRSDIIISTGGLGPTFDDLTREAVAKVLDRPLALDRETLSAITQHFIKRNVEMPKNNERQAYVVEGAKILQNAFGTAPGQIIEIAGGKGKAKKPSKIIVLLPGPPQEMQSMFEAHVFSYLKKFETKIKKRFTLHIFGMPESAVDEKIRPIIEAERKLESENVEFGILAHKMIIDVKASVSGEDELNVDETINALKNELHSVLGDNIYGQDKQTLESVVGDLFIKNRKTLSIAESCTGGLVAHRVTNVPGSSLYFRQCAVVYSNESKIKILGVNEDTINNFGAVSEQTAVELAEGMRNKALTDYAISITGIAGPAGGTSEKPIGLVYIGICGPDIKQVFKYNFSGNRLEIRERATNQALDLLRRELIKIVKK